MLQQTGLVRKTHNTIIFLSIHIKEHITFNMVFISYFFIPVAVSPSHRVQQIDQIAIAGHHYIEKWPFR
jgi:hypothetical protein